MAYAVAQLVKLLIPLNCVSHNAVTNICDEHVTFLKLAISKQKSCLMNSTFITIDSSNNARL